LSVDPQRLSVSQVIFVRPKAPASEGDRYNPSPQSGD